LDSSFLVSLGVLVIGVSLMIVFVCIPANVDKDELEKKKIKEVERGEEEDAGRKEEKDIELGESVESSIKIAPTPEELSHYEKDKVQPVAAAPNELAMIKNRAADSNYSSNASENDHSAQESGNSAPNDEDSLEGNEGCISEKSSSSSSGSSNNDNSSNSSGYSSKDSSINSFDSFSSVSFEDYEV
jgi:type IV secretory pathway VirB10-like protein